MLKKTLDGARVSGTRERRFRRQVRAADAVITPNEYLANLAGHAGVDPARINVIPSVIDFTRWSPRNGVPKGAAKTLGWLGSPSNLPHLEVLRPVLVRLSRRYEGLKLSVVCEKAPELEGVRVEHKPFAVEDEVADVRSFEIALAPLIEDAWTRGKTPTKLLSYFAAARPVVASDVQPHRLHVKDGHNGFLCGTLTQWEERLESLIEKPQLRGELGGHAREHVKKDHSLDAMVPKYLALLQKLESSG